MCLSLPGQVLQVQGAMAQVKTPNRTAWFNALMQPNLKPGDYVLVHANLVIALSSEEEALSIEKAASEIEELLNSGG